MPASFSAHPTVAGSEGHCEVHRKLQDKVLQSAEDAVLSQAVSSGTVELPLPEAGAAAATAVTIQGLRAQVKRRVAAQPCQSALLAAATGALVMLLLRSQLHQRSVSRSRDQAR